MMMEEEEDPFAGLSDLSDDDLRIINAATQFMCLSENSSNDMQAASANNTAQLNPHAEVLGLREQLARATERVETLERSILQIQQERITKEGEAAVLRDRLVRLEKERGEMLAQSIERLQHSEHSKLRIEEEYRREIGTLKAALQFKDQEIELITHRMDHLRLSNKTSGGPKERRLEPPSVVSPKFLSKEVPEGFEELSLMHKKKRPASPEPDFHIEKAAVLPPSPTIVPPSKPELTPRQILDSAMECVEYVRALSHLLYHDRALVLEQKQNIHRALSDTGSILASLEIAYDAVLKGLRQAVFIYISRLIAAVLEIQPELAQHIYLRAAYPACVVARYPEYTHCQLVPKMCRFLARPPFGLHPWILQAHLSALKPILSAAGASVPLEVKDDLLESGMLARYLVNCTDDEKLLLEYVQVIALMTADRSAAALLLKAAPAPSDASLLAIIFDVVMLAIVEFLLLLGRGNIVPLHVAFDKRFLSQLVQYLTRRAWNHNLPMSRSLEFALLFEALHFVLVERNQSPRALLPGAYFGLHFCLEELLKENGEGSLQGCLRELYKCTGKAVAEWIAERDAARVPVNEQFKITHIT